MAAPSVSSNAAQRIRERAAEYEALVQKDVETREAQATFLQLKEEYLTRREKLWNSNRREVEAEKSKQYKKFQSLKNSNFRQLLKPGYKAAVEKAEDEYVALSAKCKAWQDEETAIEKVRARRDAAEALYKTNGEARVALNEFYTSIFQGPTPDYPEEDELEKAAEALQKEYDQIQERLSQSAAVVNKVSQVGMGIRRAINNVQWAHRDFMKNLQERDAVKKLLSGRAAQSVADDLELVKKQIAESEALWAEARAMDDQVGAFYQPSIVDVRKILGTVDDFGFGTIECDNGFSDEILATRDDIKVCEKHIDDAVEAADQRRSAWEKERPQLAAARDAAQEKLTQLRADIVQRVLREGDEVQA